MPKVMKSLVPKGETPTVPSPETIDEELTASFTEATDTVVIEGNIDLRNAAAVRGEMARVYTVVRQGKIPIHAGTRMIFALVQLHKAKIEADKLRVAGRLADQMQAFGGLQIIGPNVPAKAREFLEDVTGPAKKGA